MIIWSRIRNWLRRPPSGLEQVESATAPVYLIGIHVGPIQGFIAAARRTRDLWFGSHILSEVSKAIGRHLHKLGEPKKSSELILPALPENMDPGQVLVPDSDLMVSNRIVALVTTDRPADVVEDCKTVAQDRWKQIAKHARERADSHAFKDRSGNKTINPIRDDETWGRQVKDVLELFGAWVRLDNPDDFRPYWNRLQFLLDARRATRNFEADGSKPGWDKSSLDGARETVLRDDRHQSKERLPIWVRMRLGLSEGEQLDCPGLVKRLCPSELAEQFTPIARIAVDPWVRRVLEQTKKQDQYARNIRTCWETIAEAHEKLASKPFASTLNLISRVKGNVEKEESSEGKGESIYRDFPYDAETLYRFRIGPKKRDLRRLLSDELTWWKLQKESDEDIAQCVKKQLDRLESELRKLADLKTSEELIGEPSPYVALLQADGDDMGSLLASAKTKSDLKGISQALTDFAYAVPGIVREHRGHCIYAGADDLLALMPLDRVFPCARELRAEFKQSLEAAAGSSRPTLSVGIGINHAFEPLSVQRQVAKEAEQLAKGDPRDIHEHKRKNALGVILNLHSGGTLKVRLRWPQSANSSANDDPVVRLHKWVKHFASGAFPGTVGYDLREIAHNFAWARGARPVLEREVRRVLSKKREQSGAKLPDEVNQLVVDALSEHDHNVSLLAEELMLCRWLAQQDALWGEPTS